MMPKKKKKAQSSSDGAKKKFKPGPSGTCEAQLFEFSNERGALTEGLEAEKTISTTYRIAAYSMLEAAEYMADGV